MRVLTIFNLKYILIFFSFFFINSIHSQNKDFVLVLDAGHGGHDSGARGPYANEKDVTLSLVKKIGALIENNNKDVKVIYTRTTDEFIPLMTRANIANKNKANLFISIHCNSSSKSAPYGTETFVLGTHRNQDNFDVAKRENEVVYMEKDYKTTYEDFDPSSPESMIGLTLMQNTYLENSLKIASYVENNFIKENRLSRGVKQAGFLVLVQTAMPAILIETGFISNYQEGQYLASEDGQNTIAKNIYDAFISYKKAFDEKSGKENSAKETINIAENLPVDTDTFYKVQFLSSFSKYTPNSSQLRGLKDIEIIKYKGKYIYYSGSSNLKSDAELIQNLAKEAGFNNATIVKHIEKENLNDEYYTIELFLSPKKYKEKDSIFKGLNNIVRQKSNNIYIYTTGKVNNYVSAKRLLENIKKLGFSDAVISRVSA
ncbi:N-acetylmuramoyl-L-alanine amidase [Apibacter muscae]|uniref:N-acetylmuramoyl-L-alanine amidase n=1 Tax=Apibacter muscae TaxID=2509004 RepID=A0A563D9H5_9FLAO|nr:N-acetylmuramoyl-L-alanine amidase [Apibacter muscae]TWP26752.1 N-acetylmuramoyl-L-alanine amidase [Apibacter muscae]